jgi:purine-nucleoside phosphorylase
MRSDYGERVRNAAASFPAGYRKGSRPKTAVVLGSGLSGIAKGFAFAELPYSAIDGFPRPTVEGHEGVMYLSESLVLCAGRFHYYEGHPMEDVVFPVFVLRELGVENLILTNAAGAVNEGYSPGSLVLIKDHLNLIGANPLAGANPARPDGKPYGLRFFDMSLAYDPGLLDIARSASGNSVPSGVYAAMSGPSYETPAEIRMLRTLGADLVGMSTVPEAIAASYLGMRVLGISCVTNMAAGVGPKKLSHAEVIETGKRTEGLLRDLLVEILRGI